MVVLASNIDRKYSMLILNSKSKVKSFRFVTVNVTPVVRNDSMEGRDWLVAPMVMITEGVHNGSDGPIFYPAEELNKGLLSWNHRPVVVYHPVVNGEGVSACSPDQLTVRKIGVTMVTDFDAETKKVKAEAWLEPARMDVVDKRVGEAIENNEVMELSTGLFMDLENTEGEWEGEKYIGIARNLQLDHLALLPDLKGACSVADGAGFLCLNEMSHDVIRMLLGSALRDLREDAWIEDIYDDYIIFEEDGKLYHQTYTEASGVVSLTGEISEVTRDVKYKKVIDGTVINEIKQTINNLKGTKMDKEKIIAALISNERTPWKEEDKETLLAMNEDVLEQLTIAGKEPEIKEVEVIKEVPATTNTEKTTQVTDNSQEEKKPQTTEEYIAAAPAGVAEIFNAGADSLKREKEKLIKTITSNKQNTFTAEELLTRSVTELIALAKLAAPIGGDKKPAANNYTGQGEVVSTEEATPEPMLMPTMNFDKDE